MALDGSPAILLVTADGFVTLGGETRAQADVTEIVITGTDGDDILTLDLQGALTIPVRYDGGLGRDTLGGPAADAVWMVTSADAGSVAGVDFVSVEHLAGAADNQDLFVVEQGASIGSVDGGGGGFDTLAVTGSTTVSSPSGRDSGLVILDGSPISYTGLEPVAIASGTVIINGADGGFTGGALSSTTETFAKDLLRVGPCPTSTGYVLGLPTDPACSAGAIYVKNFDPSGTVETAEYSYFVISGTTSVTINGGLGSDTVEFEGDYLVPGSSLTVNAEHIKVKPGVTINVGSAAGNNIVFNAVYKDNGISVFGITTTIPVLGTDGLIDVDGANLTGHTITLAAFAGTLSTKAKGAQSLGTDLIVDSISGFENSGSFTATVAGTEATCTYTGRDVTAGVHKFTGVAGCSGAVADGSVVKKDITENGSGTGINHAGLDLEYFATVNVHGASTITAAGNVTLSSTVDVTATANAAAGPDKGAWVAGTGYSKGDVVKGSDDKRYAATKDIVAGSADSNKDPVGNHGLLDPWTEAKDHDASVAATFVLAIGRSQLSGTSSISTPTGDVTISSSVKTKVATNADSSASGLGAGIAVAVFVITSEAFIDSTNATPITAKNLTVSADADDQAPTTATASPKGAQGTGTDPNDPTQKATTNVRVATTLVEAPGSPQDLEVDSTASFAVTGTFTGDGITGTCSYSGMDSDTIHNVTGCSGSLAVGAKITGTSVQEAEADGKADNQSKTAEGSQDKSAALAVNVFFATTQAYIAPADGSAARTIAVAGGSVKVHAGAKHVVTATADAGNVKFSPDAPKLTAQDGGSLADDTTYYYRITALYDGAESLASPEASLEIASGATKKTIKLEWQAVSGATGYKIYRGTSSGDVTLLATVGAVVTYTDNGSATPDGTTKPPTSDATSGWAIAVSVNYAVVTTKAYLARNADINASTVIVEAVTPASGTSTFTTDSTSGAGGSDVGVAGSIAVTIVVYNTTAGIEGSDPVDVGGADLTLAATSKVSGIAKAGAKQTADGETTGVGASWAMTVVNDTTTARLPDGSVLTGADDLTVNATSTNTVTTEATGGATTGSGSFSLGAQIAVTVSNVTTSARIGTGSALTLTGALSETATQTATVTTKAKGAAKGGTAALGAAIALSWANHFVDAQLQRDVSAVGAITVSAAGTSKSTTQADASSAGAEGKADADPNGTDSSGKDINEKSDDNLKVATDASDASTGQPAGTSDTNTPEAKADSGGTKVTVAAAISMNLVDAIVRATIADGVTVTATGLVKVSSSANTDAKATADGSAKGVDDDEGSTAGSIGVAVAVNDVDLTNEASIGNGSVSGSAVTIEAVMKDAGSGDLTHKYEAEATSGASDARIGVAGSFAANYIGSTTSATGKGTIVTTSGDLKVDAKTDALLDAKATATSIALENATAGVGASIASNELTATVFALLMTAGVTSAGAVNVTAKSKGEIKSRSLSGAVAKKEHDENNQPAENCTEVWGDSEPVPCEASGGLEFSGAGAGSDNDITNTVRAEIVDSTVTATAVSVTAEDESDIQAIAGALAAIDVTSNANAKGLQKADSTYVLGASIALNSITNVVRVRVSDSTVAASSGGVVLLAKEKAKILAITVTAAGTLNKNDSDGFKGFAFQGAGSGSGNSIETTVEALIEAHSSVSSGAGAPVSVTATDDSDITADGGGAAIARTDGSSFSLGASIAINDVIGNVRAAVDNSTVAAGGDLVITATSSADIFALTIAAAATNTVTGAESKDSSALNLNVAGAYSWNTVENHTNAEIIGFWSAPITTANGGKVRLEARDEGKITVDAGGAAIEWSQAERDSVGLGAAVAIDEVTSNARATISGATVNAAGNVELLGESAGDLWSLALGISGSVSTATSTGGFTIQAAGSLVFNAIDNDAVASISNSGVTAGGSVLIDAKDTSSILGIAGAGAFIVAADASGAAIGASIVLNEIEAFVRAEIEASNVTAGLDVKLTAISEAEIDGWAIAGGGSIGTGGSGSSTNFTGAGSVVVNSIKNLVSAAITNSSTKLVKALAGEIRLFAKDDSEIDAVSGAAAFGLSQTNSGGDAVSAGAAFAFNDIANEVSATAFGPLEAATDLTIEATSTALIFALTVGIAGVMNTGSGGGTSFAGAGSGSGNSTTNKVNAKLSNAGSTVGGDLRVTATDQTEITAAAGSLSLVVMTNGPPQALALGISIASNDITNEVKAELLTSAPTTTLTVTGSVELLAESTATINAYTFAGGGSYSSGSSSGFSFNGAGAGSLNDIHNTIEARLSGGTISAADVSVTATDHPTINSIAGALGAGVTTSGGQTISVGAAFAVNNIGNTTTAATQNATITTTSSAVNVIAESHAEIDSLALGIAGSLSSGSGSGFGIGGAGSVAYNTIANTTLAEINGGSVTTGGSVLVKALDHALINADGGGVAIVLAANPPTGFAIGISIAVNDVTDAATAQIWNGAQVSAASVEVNASSTSTIDAFTVAGGGAGGSGKSGIAAAGAGAISFNTIDNDVTAAVLGATTVITTTGLLLVTATDDATIDADAGAIAIGIVLTSSGGASVTIAVAWTSNEVTNTTTAAIDDATVHVGSLTVSATSTTKIDVLAFGIAGALTAASGSGFSLAAAGSVAINDIASVIEARLLSATVDTNGAVSVTATDSSDIDADAGGAAAAIAAGSSGTVGLAAAASIAINGIANTTRAIVDATSVGASGDRVASLTVEATSNGFIDSLAIVGAVAVTASQGVGGSAVIAGAVTANQITNTVEAWIRNGSVVWAGAGTPSVKVKAGDTSTIDADAASAAFSVSLTAGGSYSGSLAGAVALNTIGTIVVAAVDASTIDTPGAVLVESSTTALIDTKSIGFAGAVAAGSGAGISLGGAGAYSRNRVANTTTATIGGASTVTSASSVTVSATDGTFITATTGAIAIGVGGGSGSGAGV
ncbi:MAG TPA: hypothetical protein VFX65_00020, partial [Candidatus Limnocylindrales bacterium]|nr:hypothetical protein [Candidatus Limnocylindrales bacterium]